MISLLGHAALGFSLAVCGATGGLGRELCQQSVEKGWHTIAMVRAADRRIRAPYRGGWLVDTASEQPEIVSPLLHVIHHSDAVALQYDALALVLGGKPFKADATTRVVRSLCSNLPPSCKRVCLVSAFGVGASIRDANPGIALMESWYLREVYSAKREQEDILRELKKAGKCDTLIVRPGALAYGAIPFNDDAMPRQRLADALIRWCESGSPPGRALGLRCAE